MCIIVLKPKGKGINITFENHLYNCFINNPDGAGYMYNDGKKVHVRKGFMTWKAFEDELVNVKRFAKETDIVFHFRYATHGSIEKGNTHPFPITSETGMLWKSELMCDAAIAHNGVISDCDGGKKSKMSDTQIFVRDYLSHIPTEIILSKGVMKLIEMATTSKFAIMTPTEVKLLGGFVKEKNGCSYSNRDYQYLAAKGKWYKSSWEWDESCDCCGEEVKVQELKWMQGFYICKKCALEVKECRECGDIITPAEESTIENVCMECYDYYILGHNISLTPKKEVE